MNNAVADHWESQYAEGPRWSGKVNAALAATVNDLQRSPGTAVDLGCGEGADVLWLAAHGWQATGVDISATALARAAETAAAHGLTDRTTWVRADLADWHPDTTFDLVTASFLHSRIELPRAEILRRASSWVSPGGHLVVISHVFASEDDLPPWVRRHHAQQDGSQHAHLTDMPLPADEFADLGLDSSAWEPVRIGLHRREAIGPDGVERAEMTDGLIVARRR